MTYILLFLFIFFIVVPVLSTAYKIWSLRRRMRRFMEDPFGDTTYSNSRSSRRAGARPTPPRSEKKIPRDVGEYVAFTEFEGHTVSEQDTSTDTRRQTESQITDVEWIDIEK